MGEPGYTAGNESSTQKNYHPFMGRFLSRTTKLPLGFEYTPESPDLEPLTNGDFSIRLSALLYAS